MTALKSERGQSGYERCGIRGGLTARERAQIDKQSRTKRTIK